MPFLDDTRSLILFFRAPSLISPPVASASLPEPAGCRGRLPSGRGGAEEISLSLEGSIGSLTIEDLRCCSCGRVDSGAEEEGGAGDIGREAGAGVEVPVGWEEAGLWWDFLGFLRADSVPLASDILGDPGRLSDEFVVFLDASFGLGRWEGVFVPFVDAPEEGLSASLPLALVSFSFSFSAAAFFSSSFFRSSSFSLSASASVSSDSLCFGVSESIKSNTTKPLVYIPLLYMDSQSPCHRCNSSLASLAPS